MSSNIYNIQDALSSLCYSAAHEIQNNTNHTENFSFFEQKNINCTYSVDNRIIESNLQLRIDSTKDTNTNSYNLYNCVLSLNSKSSEYSLSSFCSIHKDELNIIPDNCNTAGYYGTYIIFNKLFNTLKSNSIASNFIYQNLEKLPEPTKSEISHGDIEDAVDNYIKNKYIFSDASGNDITNTNLSYENNTNTNLSLSESEILKTVFPNKYDEEVDAYCKEEKIERIRDINRQTTTNIDSINWKLFRYFETK